MSQQIGIRMNIQNNIFMGSPDFGSEEAAAVQAVMASGWVTQGKKTVEFEANLSDFVSAQTAVAMNSGTATLHGCLSALGVKPGDEVIVPSLTYISSASTIFLTGAVPVFVDCDPQTFNVTERHIAEAMSEKTTAVMTVDMKGMPVDYDAIKSILPKNVALIADSAESLGASYKSTLVGTQADLHSFSFFANKNITTGEGGAISLPSRKAHLDEFLRSFRNQGQSKKRYFHDILGFNYRLTDIAASIGIVQLKKLNRRIQRKSAIARLYGDLLKDCHGVELPYMPEFVTAHAWYNYCLRFESNQLRDRYGNVVTAFD